MAVPNNTERKIIGCLKFVQTLVHMKILEQTALRGLNTTKLHDLPKILNQACKDIVDLYDSTSCHLAGMLIEVLESPDSENGENTINSST